MPRHHRRHRIYIMLGKKRLYYMCGTGDDITFVTYARRAEDYYQFREETEHDVAMLKANGYEPKIAYSYDG